MPIYEYSCRKCGCKTEKILPVSEHSSMVLCKCGSMADQIFTPSGHYCGNQDAGWLKEVLQVVDKHDNKPTTAEFIKHPTRANYRSWMKAEGIRPLEDNEKREKPKPWRPTTKQLLDRLMERRRIEI